MAMRAARKFPGNATPRRSGAFGRAAEGQGLVVKGVPTNPFDGKEAPQGCGSLDLFRERGQGSLVSLTCEGTVTRMIPRLQFPTGAQP